MPASLRTMRTYIKWNTRFQFSNFMPSHWILILYFVWGVVMVNYSHWPRYFKHLRFFEDIYANLSAVDDYCYFCFKFWKCILLLSLYVCYHITTLTYPYLLLIIWMCGRHWTQQHLRVSSANTSYINQFSPRFGYK